MKSQIYFICLAEAEGGATLHDVSPHFFNELLRNRQAFRLVNCFHE